MYVDIIFRNDYSGDHTVLVPKVPLSAAKYARRLSGDVAVHHNTTDIVKDKSWLFDWELKDPNSYAHKLILGKFVGKAWIFGA